MVMGKTFELYLEITAYSGKQLLENLHQTEL